MVVTGSVTYIITHDKDIKASEQDGGMKPSSMEFMKMAMYGLKAQRVMKEEQERQSEMDNINIFLKIVIQYKKKYQYQRKNQELEQKRT